MVSYKGLTLILLDGMKDCKRLETVEIEKVPPLGFRELIFQSFNRLLKIADYSKSVRESNQK